MTRVLLAVVSTVALCATAFTTLAQDDELEFASQIEARQSLMKVNRFYLGLLGGMARGNIPYDAELASNAADNMLAINRMKNGAMWPAGSDLSAEGYEGVSYAKPELWANYDEIREKGQALTEALETMAAVAGDGLEAVQANVGAIGNGCKGCHEIARVKRD
ncbi:MAG TPA: cytochrome c [Xanthomonadales bacterium]|nr:cytochrome c [Xanthomonadales bacterium]